MEIFYSYKNIIYFTLILFFTLVSNISGFDKRYPAKPVTNEKNFRNFIDYDENRKICLLSYVTANNKLTYKIDLNNGGNFGSISAKINDFEFYPCKEGVFSIVDENNKEFQNKSNNVSYILQKAEVRHQKFYTQWVMKIGDYYVKYSMDISISGKTLIIKATDIGEDNCNNEFGKRAKISAVLLGRSENCIDPSPIRIPYLTNQNILYTNGVFVSTFFDWTKTNCSKILRYNEKYSESSIYFSQYCLYLPLSNGKINKLNETIYITVSENIDETFPSIPNPVSKYKSESVSRIIFDSWKPFNQTSEILDSLIYDNYKNIWLIVHNWHNKGYDSEYPDIFPPNPRYGGIDKLSEISNLCKSNNFLFSVHEMYSLIGSDNPNFENYKQYLTIGFDGNFVIGWNNPIMYKVKPSKMEKIFNDKNRGILINKKLNTTAGYLDVHSASDPSEYIDYDYKETGAGKFKYALRKNQEIADVSRKIHNGPVSGEGSSHFYYSGYYDDVEPQIVTASDFFSGDHIIGGYYQPVLVDFDLLKIKPLMFAHGMGYYERFFHKDRYWKHMGRSLDSALIYSATELAYGHGAFFSDLSYDIYEQSKLEYEYVYPVQLLYGNSSVKSILYNDNGNLITLSDYLRKYPKTYDKFNNQDFISQVFIEYENGVKIFVNRHPEKTWDIELTDLPGWYNYHGIINGSDKLYTGSQNPGRIILNKESGWICYSPVFPIIDN